MVAPGQSGGGLRFGLLGALEVRRDGRPLALGGPRQRTLLATFLLHPNTPVSSDRLIDRLWGETAPANAANALQVQVSRLRVTLAAPADAPAVLVTCPSGYELRVGAGELDADRFESFAEEGRRALAAGAPRRAADLLRDALALWRGPALADLVNASFLQTHIAQLDELRIAALEERIEADLALGRHGVVIAELERLVAEEPLRERPRGQLMLALYRCGRQAEALTVYRQARETLSSELGLEPSPPLVRLERAILQHDPSVLAPVEPPPQIPAEEPSGLAPVGPRPQIPADNPVRFALPPALAAARETPFVARPRELDRLLADGGLLDGRTRVTLVTGEAGAGKTRLAAEVAGSAQAAGWTVLYGRADDRSPIPYQPIVEALRDSPAVRPRLERTDRAQLGPELAAVAAAVPGLRGLAPGSLAPVPGDPAAAAAKPCECARQFEGLAAVIVALARGGPLLLVLDDLHWADRHTLLLLRHIARSAMGAPLAVLATARAGEPGRSGELSELVAELRRDHGLDRIAVTGFDETQTAALIQRRLPRVLSPALTSRLRDATGGNPQLAGEVLDELAGGAGHDPLPVPAGLRDRVRRELDGLGAHASEVMLAAAFLGPAFSLVSLEALFPDRGAAVLEAVERALATGLVVEARGAEDRYAFAPPLLCHAIRQLPSGARSRRLRRRIDALLRGEPARSALEAIGGFLAPEHHLVSGLQGR